MTTTEIIGPDLKTALRRLKLGRMLDTLPERVDGCEDCLATGDGWVHLRICVTCGHVGCCDDSPNRHATAHHETTGHPIIRSLEPGEQWSWCYLDGRGFLADRPTGETAIPPSPLLS